MRSPHLIRLVATAATALLLLGGALSAAHAAEHGDEQHEHFGALCAVVLADEVAGSGCALQTAQTPNWSAADPVLGYPQRPASMATNTLPPPTGPPLI